MAFQGFTVQEPTVPVQAMQNVSKERAQWLETSMKVTAVEGKNNEREA
jgi:hypothetical protein